MRLLLVLTIALGTLCSQAWTYSKYGRTCVDIGCVQNEVCVMKEDPCPRVARVRNCGPYPTCERVSSAPSTCATYVCPPTQECQLHNGAPRCVTKVSPSNSHRRREIQTTLYSANNYPQQPAYNPQYPSTSQPIPVANSFPGIPSAFFNNSRLYPAHLVFPTVNQYPQQYPGAGVNQYPGIGINQYPGTGVNQYPGTGINNYPGTGFNQYPNTGVNQYPNTGINQYPGAGVNQYPGTGINQYPGNVINRYPAGIGVNQYPGVAYPGVNNYYPGVGVNNPHSRQNPTYPNNPTNDFYRSQTGSGNFPNQGYQGGNLYTRHGY